MKTLQLKFSNTLLSTEQMQKISGGELESYACNGQNYSQNVYAHNCCEAQGLCDAVAFDPWYTDYYPNGGDVVCGDNCN